MSAPTNTRSPGKQFDGSDGPKIVGPAEGHFADLLTAGARFMVWAEESGGSFSLVEHPIPPRTLVAPLHRHSREDEYSFVLEGRMGAVLGGEVVYAEVGDLAFKPRGQWHTFWNAGDEPCRILEIISPGGFEKFFEELGDSEGPLSEDLLSRYGLDMDMESVPRLCAEHGLEFPTGPPE